MKIKIRTMNDFHLCSFLGSVLFVGWMFDLMFVRLESNEGRKMVLYDFSV